MTLWSNYRGGVLDLMTVLETHALLPDSEHLLVFVTPEWVTNTENQSKLQILAKAGKLAFFSIDEAHLFAEWREFRSAFNNLREFKVFIPLNPHHSSNSNSVI